MKNCRRILRIYSGGEVVGCAFIVELTFLGGRERLSKYDLHALIEY